MFSLNMISFCSCVGIQDNRVRKDYREYKNYKKVIADKAVYVLLHKIISVVWVTNFLSQILNQSTHDDDRSLSLADSGGGSRRLSGQSRFLIFSVSA